MKPSSRIIFLLIIFLYGCNSTDVNELAYKAVESDILTIEAESGVEPGTSHKAITGNTADPTPKPKKTSTAVPNPTKTKFIPTKTLEPSYPTLYADQNYQCREGPGKAYEHAADIHSGTSYRIIGRASNGWYRIAIDFANTSHKDCWIGGGVPHGDISSLPVVQIESNPSNSSSGNSSGASEVHVTLYCMRNDNLKQCGAFVGTCAELTHSDVYQYNGNTIWVYSTSPETMFFYHYEAHRVCPADYK